MTTMKSVALATLMTGLTACLLPTSVSAFPSMGIKNPTQSDGVDTQKAYCGYYCRRHYRYGYYRPYRRYYGGYYRPYGYYGYGPRVGIGIGGLGIGLY